MSILNKIIKYLIAFFVFILLLWLLGFVNSSLLELLSYFSLTLGISIVLISFGNNKKTALFSGTIIFLLGLIFFILNNFDFEQTNNLIIPAFLFILGTGFFILFLDNFSNKKNLILFILFWITGFVFTLFSGEFNISTFSTSLKDVAFSFWTIILLVVGAFLLLNNYTKK
ncbi:MAG: hypothetical protein IIB07_03765 [Bacteroidetes bacterium]|nr:hypothetical protein [Bacteroidota bacterium]MCH8170234.1 hypothetical protein [Bacteroidota bacterium]MCH8941140.1 hypothetical protein [Bacteroidota bacterium]